MKLFWSVLLALILLIGCNTTEPTKSDLLLGRYELVNFKLVNYMALDSISLEDTIAGSHMTIDFLPNNEIDGFGRIGFTRWPGQVLPDGTQVNTWIYRGRCLDNNCLEAEDAPIQGWYDELPDGEIRLYLKDNMGSRTWLEDILLTVEYSNEALYLFYDENNQTIRVALRFKKDSL